jgi:hypothetical protein
VERVNAVGKKLVKLLDLESEQGVQLEFQVRLVSPLCTPYPISCPDAPW